MNRILLTFITLLTISFAQAQGDTLVRYIMGTGGQITDTLDNNQTVTLDLSTDDVEQENDDADSYYDDDLDAGWEGAPEDQNLLHLGLRFRDLNLPQGVLIDSAFIVFHAHEGKGAEDVAELTIVGVDEDNPATFDENNFNANNLLTDRTYTSAQVEWTVAEEWTIWQAYKTADIKDIVQELVDRPGWAPGNAMAFILVAQDQGPSIVENAREFTSFENIADPDDVDPQGNPGDGTNHPERRPYLRVHYDVTNSVSEINAEEPFFQFYPNPVNDYNAQIQFESSETANVQIFNTAGQLVKSFQTNGVMNQIDLSDLNQGLYMMHVDQNGQTGVKRVVIK